MTGFEPIRIKRIEMREIHMPLLQPYRISSGIETGRRVILIEMEEEGGTTAWSECVPMTTPNYLPETVDTAWLALENWLVPRIMDVTVAEPQAVQAMLDLNIRGHNMAKACLEMGIWTMFAEIADMPLAGMLGGSQSSIVAGISLGIQSSPGALADVVSRSREEGYRRVKVKIGPGEDVGYLEAAREAAGSDVLVMADANSAYALGDLDTLKRIDDLNLLMIEQPLAWDDFIDHAQLQRHLRTPICLDESICSIRDLRHMISLGSGRIVNIKPGRVGGFASAIQIRDMCLENGMPVWCGGMLETGIGRACNVALASLEGFTLPGDISPSNRYWAEDIVTPEWTMSRDGAISVPLDQAGLGVSVRTDRIEALTVRSRSFLRA